MTTEQNTNMLPTASEKKGALLTPWILAPMVVFGIGVVLYAWGSTYTERLAPNTFVLGQDVGGMTFEALEQKLQQQIDDFVVGGVPLVYEGSVHPLALSTIVSDDVFEDVVYDLPTFMQRVRSYKRAPEHPVSDAFLVVKSLVFPIRIHTIPNEVDHDRVLERTKALFETALQEPVNATWEFTYLGESSGWVANVVADTPGTTLDSDKFLLALDRAASLLDTSPILVTSTDREAEVTRAHAEYLSSRAEQTVNRFASSPLSITFEEGTSQRWSLSQPVLRTMLIPTSEGLGLEEDLFSEWLIEETASVAQPSVNARFAITDGRVEEFIQSKPGREIDVEATQALVLIALNDADVSQDVPLQTAELNPEVTTAEGNDLGITEILGTGISSYRGSPLNRRRNIQNGVDLLNGLLIAPDETFSLVEALKPFTIENGYLPELVIKGDSIEPEVGGGLCQIGTTTFRTTMHSGLPVDERQNHSLVVSYYNDPSNGNPGTDATIYDSSPDFKFTNDTGQYILFQAENLTESQELRFTFWGTSDGRKGSYTPPEVTRWIPVGETRYVETENLEPGKERCQEAHIGADATFIYTVVRPTGAIEETVFDSHYRPLPRICLVGKDPEAEPSEEEEGEDAESKIEAIDSETESPESTAQKTTEEPEQTS